MTASSDEPRTPFREWPAAGRWVVYGVIGLVIAIVAGLAGTAAVVRRSFPVTNGTITLSRLTAPVDVHRDGLGVPFLRATDARDLFLAQGYVQAQDRFFAMDVARHRAAGRLAELLGASAVPGDLVARTLGWQRLAEDEYSELSPTTKSYLRAFSAGVNAYLGEHSPSRSSLEYMLLEFAGLNYRPEPWTPTDSLAILKSDDSSWRGDVTTEVERARLAVDRTPEQVDALYPDGDPDAGEPDAFAVAGAHTASGKPLVADAPDVVPGVPSPWIQVGLRCREITPTCAFDVTGATLPGVPGVLVGHNADVAWGLGRTSADVADLFLEKVDGKQYLRGKRWIPLIERDELIRVQGESSRRFTVRSTTAGPLLSDVSGEVSSVGANAPVPDGSPERANGYAVALAATALAASGTADAVFDLDLASDATEVRVAAADLALPGHDLVYADSEDRIGRIELGPLPVRAIGSDGADPAPAWRKGGWPARRPADAVEIAPADGVVGGDARVRSLVSASGGWTASGLTVVQSDTRNPIAPDLVPLLLRILVPSQYYADGQRLLAEWDYNQPEDSAAAAYFNVVWSNLLRLTFHDQLKESLWPDGDTRWMQVVRDLLDQPQSSWWDDATTDAVVEDRDTILGEALRDARDELTRTLARDPSGWTWGALHRLRLEDGPLRPRDLGPFDVLLDRGPYDVGGGPGTAAGTPYDAARDDDRTFDVVRAPGLRFVADLGAPDSSRWVSLTGASGHAFEDHYLDQNERWRAGGAFVWPFTAERVRLAGEDLLRLRPRD